MAATALSIRLSKTRKIHENPNFFRLYSSSSTTESPNANNNAENDNEKTNFSSCFTDLKSKLKQSPPRVSPTTIPSSLSSNQQPSTKSQGIEEMKRNLAQFQKRYAAADTLPTSSSSSSQQISNQELYNNNPNHNLSLSSITAKLTQSRKGVGGVNEAVKGLSGRTDNLPDSVFGKEIRENVGEKSGANRLEFLRTYSYADLGDKLRALRPEEAKNNKGFSLGELNERLVKFREMEEEEDKKGLANDPYRDLKSGLISLKHSSDNKSQKKVSTHRISILGQLGATLDFMSSPPKENLVEKYFHPDNMSSSEKMKIELKKVRDEFKMSESDCGSARVQVAQLTTKIKHLSTALHKKDKHSRKGLQAMVQRRKKLLKYLRRTDWDSYCLLLSKFGLRDNPDYKN